MRHQHLLEWVHEILCGGGEWVLPELGVWAKCSNNDGST